ncbi:LysR substrate-binding domain-containing protein [Clostridium sp. DSM 100503]|nr:LysR substrate-binding domain-containing protein [Clostridium sp. DSM 100503]
MGSCMTIANFILPTIIEKFQGVCKSTPTKIIVDNARSIENMLCKNEIDLGLIEGVVYNEELERIPFSSYELVVVCSNKHKFVKENSIMLNELVKEKLLLREKGSSIRDIFDSALLLHDIRVNPSWTSVNSQVLIEAAKKNLGITVLPKVLVENEIDLGNLIEVNVNELNLSNVNNIVFYKGKVQTNSFKELVNIIKNIV